jgi:two-component system cell cycle sensor histidine kinase/response regulator CckA
MPKRAKKQKTLKGRAGRQGGRSDRMRVGGRRTPTRLARRTKPPSRAPVHASGGRKQAASSEVRTLRAYCRELDRALARSEQANNELRRTLANYRLLFTETPNPIFVLDRSGRFVGANPAALKLTRCSLAALKKKRAWDFAPRAKRAQQRKDFSPLTTRKTVEAEFLVNGKCKTLLLNLVPITVGRYHLLFAMGQDLTQRKQVEESLRESEAVAKALLGATVDAIAIMDSRGMVLACNETSARHWGKWPLELLGSNVFKNMDRATAKRRRSLFEKVFRTGKPLHVRYERAGRHFDTVISPILDAHENVTSAVAIARDVTAIEHSTRILAQKEASLAESQAIAHLGSWEQDLQTGRNTWSEEQYRIFGHKPYVIVPSFELFISQVHPNDRERLWDVQRNILKQRAPLVLEFRIIRPDGSTRWLLSRYKIFRDSKGRLVRIAGTNLDITELRLAETAALKSEATARALFNAQRDAIALIAKDDRLVDLNEAALRLAGLTRAQAVRIRFYDMLELQRLQERRRLIDSVFETGKPERFEGTYAGRHFDVSIYPVIDRTGKVQNVLIVAHDITVLKQALQERTELQVQLLHAQKLESLGVLAGGIAHDFNNFLTSILGQADLALLALPPRSPARTAIQELIRTTHRAAGVTNQMLAYSGKGQFVVGPLNLGKLLQEMRDMINVFVSRKTTLKFDIAPRLSLIEAEEAQIRQVILNLVINASEALTDEPGAVSVSVGQKSFRRNSISGAVFGEHLPEGTYVYLEVKDSGLGMKEDTLERIFDPFFTTKSVGRGLGLSTVLGIVKGHKGAISVRSAPGRGSVFTVLFPIVSRTFPKREEPALAPKEFRGAGTILLVDDEEIVRKPCKKLLEKLGFEVLAAADGKAALKIFRAHQREIRCVLLDLTMPKMSGDEVFRELRRIKPDTKVILTSGYGEMESVRRFPGRRPEGFIQKPYRLSQLVETLREVLDREERTVPGPVRGRATRRNKPEDKRRK